MKRSFLIITVLGALLAGNIVMAEENQISTALKAVGAAQNGAGVAQGLFDVGKSLNSMGIDGTIAFRTALSLLANSGVVAKDSPEWNMLDVLWTTSEKHLVITCANDPTSENANKVNITLGRPYKHCIAQ